MIDFGIFTIDGVKRFLFDALRIDGCEFGDMQLRFRSDEVGTYADVRERLGESLAPDDLLLHLRHVTATRMAARPFARAGFSESGTCSRVLVRLRVFSRAAGFISTRRAEPCLSTGEGSAWTWSMMPSSDGSPRSR